MQQYFSNIQQDTIKNFSSYYKSRKVIAAESIFEEALLWTPFIHDHEKVESGQTECNCKLLATSYCLKCDSFHCSICKLSDCKFVTEELF